MAMIIQLDGVTPEVAEDAFLAPTAVLIGNVTVESKASIWFGAVLRGDDPDHGIVVGEGSSIQDNCVLHVGAWGPTLVGAYVTVGHGAKFESCSIGDRSVIGMNAIILQNAIVGEECLIGANAVVLEGQIIPPRSLAAGVPAKIKKTLDGSAAEWIAEGGRHYVELSRHYLSEGIGSPPQPRTSGQSGINGRSRVPGSTPDTTE